MIIGLGFLARSGKDTVGDHLVGSLGFEKIAFADALKKGCAAIFGLSQEQLYGELKGEQDPFWLTTPRHILQQVGTECMRRGFRDDIWVKCVERIILLNKDVKDWVITDVRFPNEAIAIKKWGGYNVRIDRPVKSDLTDAAKLHASETAMVGYDEWDHVILNNKDLPHLYEVAEQMVMSLGDQHAKTHAEVREGGQN